MFSNKHHYFYLSESQTDSSASGHYGPVNLVTPTRGNGMGPFVSGIPRENQQAAGR